MKKTLAFIALGISVFVVAVFIAFYIWTDLTVKVNIRTATEKYPGTAEDALISYLQDSENSPASRSYVAVWTLGQIKSRKALPLLKELYKNDPRGESCYGRHDSLLCQHELYNAIRAIESKWWPLHARLNK